MKLDSKTISNNEKDTEMQKMRKKKCANLHTFDAPTYILGAISKHIEKKIKSCDMFGFIFKS